MVTEISARMGYTDTIEAEHIWTAGPAAEDIQPGRSLDTLMNLDVPIWEKYTLTIEEAAKYFRIGENKLRRLAEENLNAGWVLQNGNRLQIKRKKFEKPIDELDAI